MSTRHLWDQILAAAPPGSVIAGGAVRDHVLGLEGKDIDVFAPMSVRPVEMAKDAGLIEQSVPEDRTSEYEGKAFVACVTDYLLGETPVQLIGTFLEPGPGFGLRLVNGFDFAITRCWYDGVETHLTPEFATDAFRNEVTLLRHDRIDRARVRAARFLGRHPGRFTLRGFPEVHA